MVTQPDNLPATTRATQRGIWPALAACSVILFSVPLIFLFYGGLGTALAGLAEFTLLIAVQFLVAWPIWLRLRRIRESELPDSQNHPGDS